MISLDEDLNDFIKTNHIYDVSKIINELLRNHFKCDGGRVIDADVLEALRGVIDQLYGPAWKEKIKSSEPTILKWAAYHKVKPEILVQKLKEFAGVGT